jgi:DNA-binding transcriptional LysR family regulator
MDLAALEVFLAVARERSFSRAAVKLHRTQPAVSQAIRRLEQELGERLVDRTSRDGTLTEAGRVLREYADELLRLAQEAASSVVALRDLARGHVLIGANEAAVHALLPVIAAFHERHPGVRVDVRRVQARQTGVEVLRRTLDLGVTTFAPRERGLHALTIADDELALLVAPAHPLAGRRTIGMVEVGRLPIVAHNDPSPARERVLKLYERRHALLNIQISLPSLDAIKRAVEMGLGVALLPRRCAVSEIERGQLVAIRVRELRLPRQLRIVYRHGALTHSAAAFLDVARAWRGGFDG